MKLMLVLLCVPGVCAGYQAVDEWSRWMERGRVLLTHLDFAGAASSYQSAVRVAERLPPHGAELVQALNGVATAHKQMGRLAEAEREYRRAIEAAKVTYLRGTATYAYLLANVGAVEIERSNFPEARRILAEAIAADEEIGPPDAVQLAIARQLLAKVLMHEGRYAPAEKLLGQAIAVMRANPQTPRDLLPFALDTLGNLRRLQGRPEEALMAFRHALGLFEILYGPEHPILVLQLNNAGVQLAQAGRTKDARALFERALSIFDKNAQTDPATKANILANYAELLRKSGQRSEASTVAREASAIRTALPVDVSMLQTAPPRK